MTHLKGLFLDHDAKVAVFFEHDDLTAAFLQRSIEALDRPAFPSDYDIITWFSPQTRFLISLDRLVAHAIERAALQRRRGARPIRSVLVDIPEHWQLPPEVWRAFFDEPDPTLTILEAPTIAEAYAVLGKSDPPDFDAMTPEPYY